MALGCLVKDYFPGSVAVTWDTVPLDGSTLTFPSIQMANSSLYVTTSQLTVSGEQPKQFTCSVFHAETNTTAMKTVSTGEPGLGRLGVGGGPARREEQGGEAGGLRETSPTPASSAPRVRQELQRPLGEALLLLL